ncbi:MAG: hypothetical protein ACI4MQ_01895 [Candidatus Coproplasma sp.]
MKKVDSGEFHNTNQYNDFSEYQPFSAEQYYSFESQKSPAETQPYDESFNNQGDSSTDARADGQTDFNDIKKEYDKLNADSSSASNPSASADTSSLTTSTQAAGSAPGGAAQAGSVAGGTAAGAGATAVAAVVIVTVAVGGGFIADFDKYVENNTGMDYVSITVDMDEIISQSDKTYSLSTDNFFIEFAQGDSPLIVPLSGGKHSYLITGLQPDKTYTYNLICNNPSLGSNSSCYSKTLTTLNSGEPTGVYDELNNYITYDETTRTASVFYSVYLSDCEKVLSNSTLYICSSEQTDFSNVNHIVYSDDELDENNFFKGSADGITYDELYLYVVGQPTSGAQTEARCLFSHKIEVGLPEDWVKDVAPAFDVDESGEEVTAQPDSFSISGALNKLNENFNYYAYVTQYNEDGTELVAKQEVDLTIDTEKLTYSLECVAYYGVKAFKYVIYTYDENSDQITVYESGEKAFTASQDYSATYTKVQPADAALEYSASGVTITVDTAFTSTYNNYSYKLVVTNSLGEVFGEYTGTGIAVIEIADFAGLDQINFTYYDLGTFADGEYELATHTTTGVEFNYIFIDVDESAEEVTAQPDSFSISEALNKLNENFNYFAYVTQYNEDGTVLVAKQEVDLTIDTEKLTYSIECGAYYGVKSFKYVIYTYDENSEAITVYESGEKQFTASQDYSAAYTKVQPADAALEYSASGVTITVDTAFTSTYNNYSYKLVVTNSLGEVFGEYTGTGIAVIEIADFAGLDQINFTYYDLGTFADGEYELATHTTTGVEFNYIFISVDESAEEVTTQPDSISISGALNKLNENFSYYAYVTQYNEDGTELVAKQEVDLTIDTEKMTYSLECGAYYGVKTLKYVIYTYDENNEAITVYESGEKAFTASQDYSATYTKVQPADATIEYTAAKITITANPEFTSEFDNYSYKLVVTNSLGEVFGEYAGTGIAVIEIADFAGLDQINFTYYDLGTFADGEYELATHTTTGVEFNYIFIDVDESAEEVTAQPDSFSISEALNKLNENFNYFAYVTQYNEDGTVLVAKQEVTLNIDPANMTYTLESGAYYGVKAFKYVIYTYDENSEAITVYESGEKAFTASQDYSATYTEVQPADATIEYTSAKITITVNPAFASTYNNYSYKLVVTNSTGEVFGEYTGTGVAVIEIADFAGLDQINFTYYDLGTFADDEYELATHTTTGVEFCMPTVSFDTEYGFNGQYFTVSYVCDMIYDYASASLDIKVIDSDGTAYTKHVDGVSEKGTIILDNIEGEPGNVTITGTFNFTDNQSDGATHSINVNQAEYAMNYSFEVTNVVADVSGYSTEMPVTLGFDYLLPDGYQIKISDATNAIDLTSDLTQEYSISSLTMDTEYNLTIQVTDADGNAWGEGKSITISKSAAEAEYSGISFYMSSPNPGDAVVTYNDDGTINIYRQIIPDAYGRDTISDDERVYYNAYIYAGYYDAEYNFIETQSYDVIGRGKYAVIENIPRENYMFTYYKVFDYNGVNYVMYGETPSGSVETVYECGSAIVDVAGGQTTITVSLSKYGKLANKILVNGTEYTYTTYSDESETNPTLVIDGEVAVTEVTIFFTEQGGYYDTYIESGEITMKGSKYGEYTITVETAEA